MRAFEMDINRAYRMCRAFGYRIEWTSSTSPGNRDDTVRAVSYIYGDDDDYEPIGSITQWFQNTVAISDRVTIELY